MSEGKTFSLEQAMAAQRKLRDMLGLCEEQFSTAAFVGMISDEIEQLRSAGHTDEQIARVLSDATGSVIDASDVGRHYASHDERRRPD